MTQAQAAGWFTSQRLGVIALILNVLCIIYLTVIKDNTTYNQVQQHDKEINDIKESVKQLDEKKIDKETYQLILIQGTETRLDIKDLRIIMLQHINK